MSAPTHAMQTNNENLSITIQASGKSAEALLAKLAHNAEEDYQGDVAKEMVKELAITTRKYLKGFAKQLETQKVDIDAIGQVALRIADLEKQLGALRIALDGLNTVTIKEDCGLNMEVVDVPKMEVVEVPAVVIAMTIPPCPPLEPVEGPLAGRKRPWSEVEEVVASEAEEEAEEEEEVVEEEEEVVEEEEEVVEEEEEVVEEEEEVVEEEEEVVEEEEEVVEEEEDDASEGGVGSERSESPHKEVVEEEEDDASEGGVGSERSEPPHKEVVEEEQEQEQEQEQELELEEFEYDYGTYYKDQNNLIYTLDFDLEITEAIGEYNPKTMKIAFYKQ
jgi:hypothetical protein